MAEGGPNPPDLETQKNEICNLLKTPLRTDDIWYLVDNKWFKQWKKYVGYDTWDTGGIGEQTTHPGPIDNSPLLKGDKSGDIKDHLIDELDYVLVPQEAWDKLVAWYGVTPGQDPLPRKVIEYGMFVKHCKVEVYLLELKLSQSNNLDSCIVKKFSKVDTIDHVEKEARALFKVPPEKESRLWNRCGSNMYDLLEDRTRTVQDAGLYQGQVLVIEVRNDDGTWPRQSKSSSTSLNYNAASSGRGGDSKSYSAPSSTIATRSYSSMGGNYSGNCNYDTHGTSSNTTPGLCGLNNLGNTCFMNSALQCMSNTPLLTDYFIDDRYLAELNNSNPLGMKGEIAKSYAELIKVMWSGNYTSTAPRSFKMAVGRFAPQFSGFQQQDCQELMAFLLDGLHEDLNRVLNKPYIEIKDSDGRPDEVVAQEAWMNYLMRNNSIIVDIFHGLLKSTLVCPDCSKLSVTFDPFCYLSLPLPTKKEKLLELVLIWANPLEKPLKMKVTVSKMSTIQDVCSAVARLVDVAPDKLLVTEVYNHRFVKILQNTDQVDSLERMDVYVYELPFPLSQNNSSVVLPVYMREKRIHYQSNNCSAPVYQLFSFPFFVTVPAKDCTYDMLYNIILKSLARYVTVPNPEEDGWCEENSEQQNGGISLDEEVNDIDGEYDRDVMAPADNSKDATSPKKGTAAAAGSRLFTLQCVNENGSMNMESLADSSHPLKLGGRVYLAADWHSKARSRFFDGAKAEEVELHESVHQRAGHPKKSCIQLRECLELFTTTEKLGADDPWYCPTCRRHQQATKKFDLWSLPQVLIIHLKRFFYNRFWRDKIDTLVEFPITNLKMQDYIINPKHEPAVYDLIAVANHYGGMGGGHYTAYAKNKVTQQWYYFDDSNVSPSTEENVVSKAAYVLFYARRGDSKGRNAHPNQTADGHAAKSQADESMDIS
ncbi:ubiquitin carboxyl-terminal hydrolase 15-like isoform X2 [Ornithodoros turicata]|uniref:ubiquitin carboxyl-terminal hydrolase 15-like isoform X2 n=1 Tax=Ornithodoros turicata TaxID=34597 RepID=UPI003138FC2C